MLPIYCSSYLLTIIGNNRNLTFIDNTILMLSAIWSYIQVLFYYSISKKEIKPVLKDAEKLAEELATTHELGARRNIYVPYQRSSCLYLVIEYSSLLGGFISFGVLLLLFLDDGFNNQMFYAAITLFVCLITNIIMSTLRNNRERNVKGSNATLDSLIFHYQKGIMQIMGKPVNTNNFIMLPWKDIKFVKYIIDSKEEFLGHTYILQSLDEKQVISFKYNSDKPSAGLNYFDLGKTVEDETLPFLFSDVLEVYQSGEPVKFGSLVVSTEGIRHVDTFFAWTEVKHIYINTGGLGIHQLELSSETRINDYVIDDSIPNVHVLKELLCMICRQQRLESLLLFYRGHPVSVEK